LKPRQQVLILEYCAKSIKQKCLKNKKRWIRSKPLL
jgi:hypothetical protein